MTNRISKIVVLTLILIILELAFSCRKQYSKFRWESLTTKIINNSLSQEIIVSASDSVCYKNFGIRLSFKPQYYAFNPISLYNGCYALKLDDIWTNADTVKSIQIISLQDFNNNYSAGEDVNDIFRCKRSDPDYPSTDIQNLITITALINYMNTPYQEEIFKYDLLLVADSVYKNEHSFIINIELSGNRVLSDTTESFMIY
ncbi:MAG: hypothetical protein CVU05_04270 [Bacteroidetes bacterium HGW-Bacteroidetes-21]|jgi:hypothetical protein|nr:MAG: hypothetical protein CVU05_04270 [Bacteroidetes bacterium HGW-Bacteroidetes-21]